MIWHEIKDLVSIYHEDSWDKVNITLWDPVQQKNYTLVFTGSTRGNGIHFNIVEVASTPDEEKRIDLLNQMVSISKSIHSLQNLNNKLKEEYDGLCEKDK